MAKRKSALAADVSPAAPASMGYTVLARRYRPQQFRALVGQEPVARALTNALESNRVAHAYLFTGARGVGKTSTARILAKALNCSKGPTVTPCDECDICQAIAVGEDVDVLEIDGASNRGIDEIRELRRNVGFRPSRARYKIYIIDEVHMLTKEAFNALLKTLEEPPSHVKFIFATTEVQKIPVTILSRCQRFDFAGIGAKRIAERLREVVLGEGMQADDEALEWIARRAAGSMRDAESLLDQLLAFGGAAESKRLSIDIVHRLLGTANDDRIVALASAVLNHNIKDALAQIAAAAEEGLQLGELVDQLIDYWRDLMVVNCAGLEERELSISAKHRETLARHAKALALDTILAGLDVLSTTKARLRTTSHGRVLLEMTLVRLSRLDDLESLAQLAQSLASPARASGDAATPKRESVQPRRPDEAQRVTKPDPIAAAPRRAPLTPEAPQALSEESLQEIWRKVLTHVGPMLAGHLENASSITLAGPAVLLVRFDAQYNSDYEHCQDTARQTRTEEALRKVTGQACSVRFELIGTTAVAPTAAAPEPEATSSRYRRQRAEAGQLPLVKRALEQLSAQIVHVDDGFGASAAESAERTDETEES